MSEIRYAWRSMMRMPWFTLAAILTFSIGIGMNVAVFSIVDGLLFRPLPYGDVDQLVLLRVCGADGECGGSFPSAIAFEGRTRLRTIDGIAVAAMPFNVRGEANDPPLVMSGVSDNLLRVLRVRPVLGRDFTDEDARLKQRVALLSFDTWRGRFGGSPDVVGQPLGSGRSAVTIVGVLPQSFIPPTWTAPEPKWDGLLLDTSGWAAIGPEGGVAVPVARLAEGHSAEAARAEIAGLVSALGARVRGSDDRPPTVRVDPIQGALFSRFRPHARLIVSAAVILLLLACANVSNLLLARGRSREHIAAIHAALGATPGRLVRAAIFESMVVCIIGAAVSVAVLTLASTAMLTVVPPLFARYATGALDLRVLLAALAAALLCATVAAVTPAVRLSRTDVLSVLRRGGQTGHRSRLRGGRLLLAIEAAFAVPLVLSGLLIVRSFGNLAGEDLGFRPEGLYTVSLRSTAAAAPPSREAALAFYEQFVEALRDAPGVRAAAGADVPVGSAMAPMYGITRDRSIRGGRYQVTSAYFETIGTPLLAGRAFTEAEVRDRARVAVLSLSAARHFFPQLSPHQVIGQRLDVDAAPLTVVGVASDHRDGYGRPPEPALFVPLGYEPSRYSPAVIRLASDAPTELGVLQQRIAQHVGATAGTVTPVSARLDSALQDPRFRSVLFSVLAAAALLLSAVGLYAVASIDVLLRRYEMGVRVSLGASAANIQRLVLSDAARPVAVGVCLGMAGAYWAERALRTFLYGIDARDPFMYAAVVVILMSAAILAAWVPARRAVRVDPVSVLRSQ